MANLEDKWDPNRGVFDSVFECVKLISERKEEIERKVKIGREKLVGELTEVYRILAKLSDKVQPTTAIAPQSEVKDLASNGYIIMKVTNLVVDEAMAADIQKTLIQGMSSRRLTFEIEDNPEKEEFCEKLAACVETMKALIEGWGGKI